MVFLSAGEAFGFDVMPLIESITTPPGLPVPYSKENEILDEEILKYASNWGKPFGFAKEQGGKLVQDLFPIKKNETEQISSSSKVDLEMHTETAFHSHAPRFVLLFCVRGDKNAGTTFSALDDIMNDIHSEDADILSQELFVTTVDKSFLDEGEQDAEINTSVLRNGGNEMVYDRTAMRGTTEEAQEALDRFGELVSKHKRTVYLETGEIAVIQNWCVAHGRTHFQPRYDGTDRWIKRVMLSRSMPPGRDIFPNQPYYIVKSRS